MDIKRSLFTYLLLMLGYCLHAQTITGRVYRGNSDTTVANAVVYYSGSLNGGTHSDDKGHFELPARPAQIPIVVSCVGYYSGSVFYTPGQPLTVRLRPKQEVLKEVTIRVDGMDRKNEIALFKTEFLGTSSFARSCIITNIDDVNLHYDKKSATLTADCDKAIVIENKKLGYTVYYYLSGFEKSPKTISMAGTYIIKDNVLPGDKNARTVNYDRAEAYNGSRMQFIRALWNNKLSLTSFKLYSPFNEELTRDNIVVDRSGQKYVHLSNRIFIQNTEDKRQKDPLQQHEQYTYIDKDGYFGDGLEWAGVMGIQRVGDLLPFEYQPENETEAATGTTEKTALSQLKQWNTLAPQEKIHLHLDKPYYSVGEDIWLKAYVVDAEGNTLADRSKILYIDLLDERDSVKQTLLLPIMNGTASGNLHLNDTILAAGNYHLCAYTKWMQNFGSEYFFRKDVSIVNALKGAANGIVNGNALAKNKPLATVADVQFFPEGGHLVAGIRTKIGFKALKPDGLGEDVSGYVVEEGSTEHLAEFSTEHAGMGIFALMPVAGKTYNAIIKHADGSEKRYPLPRADESGYILNVNRVGDSLYVRISASPSLTDGREVALIAQCNGVVRFAAKTKLDKTTNLSYINANKFPTGIIQFTLFSPGNSPVAERLIFIDRNDGLTTNINADKTEYAKRGKVNINLDVKDAAGSPAVGSFSIAVTDEGKVSMDENNEVTILSNLLLTSDIKGYIQQPNYYFNPNNPDRLKHLDQLLLTQGWRRFSWTDLLADKYPVIKYQPEQGLAVTGSVLTLGNKPVPKAKVTLFAKTGGFPLIADTVADEQGHFVFNGLDISDSAKVMVKAIRGNNGTQIRTIIDKKPRLNYAGNYSPIYVSSVGLDNYLQQTREQFTELAKLGLMKNSTMLKEVKIKAIKERDKFIMAKMIPHSANIDPGNADYVIKQDELEKQIYLSDALRRIPGLDVVEGPLGVDVLSTRRTPSMMAVGSQAMLVVIDGAQLTGMIASQSLKAINPHDLAGVEVLTGQGKAMYGSAGTKGVLIITTKRGGENDAPSLVFNVAHYTPQGYTPVKEFYSPAYDTPDQSKMTDLRSTIYWDPNVVTGSDGKANIAFYNADGTGTYKITLEGMDTRGGLVRKVFTYEVK